MMDTGYQPDNKYQALHSSLNNHLTFKTGWLF